MPPSLNKIILYEDANFLVVDKPAGLATIPGGWEADAPNLAGLLEAEYGPSTGLRRERSGERSGQAVWTVHRLDKDTSGVILFARNAAAHRTLSLLFETHTVRKTYHAICIGVPKWDEHTARHPLRFNVGHSHRTVVDHSRGKPSETAFRVLERFAHHSLLEARPATGRTHQVRVHAYALGFPLLGDALYCNPPAGRDAKVPQRSTPIHRPALHAVSLEFEFEGKSYSFTAPYPKDFAKVLEKLRAGR